MRNPSAAHTIGKPQRLQNGRSLSPSTVVPACIVQSIYDRLASSSNLRTSHEAAGESSCGLALTHDDLARDERGDIAVNALDEPATSRREVVDDLRRVKVQAVVVDHVHVGLGTTPKDPSVVEPNCPRVIARQSLDGPRQWHARSAPAVARPVRQHISDGAGIT